jgi:hypothetical protein
MRPLRASLLSAAILFTLGAAAAPLLRRPLPIDIGQVPFIAAMPLVSADFDGDGFVDVATSHEDGRLVVALANGSGPFAPSMITVAPANISAMAASDVDLDGDVDLVYLNGVRLATLLGNGDGTFATGSNVAADEGVLALGDFNGDGTIDAAIAGDDPRASAVLSIHFGNGSGGFGAVATSALLPSGATAIATAKLDGDALDDIIVTSLNATRVYAARPGGTIQLVAGLTGGVAVATGRFNADAVEDVAIVHLVGRDASLFVYAGNGGGTFAAGPTYPLPEDGPIVTTDLDGDGLTDLVTTSAVVTYFRGLGTGAFDAPRFSPIAPDSQPAVADFDRDGELDLVTLQAEPPALEFVKGNGDGTFGADRMVLAHAPPALDDEAPGAAIDMNGDLRADAVVLVDRTDGTRAIALLRNDGSGALLAPELTPTGIEIGETTLVAGNVDGDLFPDVIVIGVEAGVDRATTFLGSASGALTRGPSSAVAFPDVSPNARLADVTGDGAADLLVDWSYYAGDGDGAFAAPVDGQLTFHVVGDFDEDGILDVVGFEDVDAPRMMFARGTGGGAFAAAIALGDGDEMPYAAGDFNGDGHLDLFCMNDATASTRVFLGNGDATFGAPIRMTVPIFADAQAVTTADLDGDGHLDVSFASSILLGNGDGRFHDVEIGSGDASGVADFDGNGRPDLCSFGDLVTVRLSGLVPEPVRDSWTAITIATLNPNVPAATARVEGSVVPVTGHVLYSVDGTVVALETVHAAAAASPATASESIAYLALPPGSYDLVATFTGDQTYRPSTDAKPLAVDRAPSNVFANASGTYGSDATVNVAIVDGADLSKLSLLKDGVVLAGVQWNESVAKVRGLDAGTHALVVDFAGDTNYLPSTHNFSLVVSKRLPTMTVTFSPQGNARVEGPVTAAVSFAAGVYGATTGTVSVTYSNGPAGSAPIANGHADVTVTLPASGYTATVQYPGDANNLAASGEFSILVYNPPGRAVALDASAVAGTIRIRWTPMLNATGYTVYRRTSFAGGWVSFQTTAANLVATTDTAPANATRMYAVEPIYSGSTGTRSAGDLATNVTLTDATLLGTPVKAVHLAELRTAVNAVRAFAGLAAASFTDAATSGTRIRLVHLTELRTALSQARSAIGMPVTYTDPSVTAGQPIRAVHFEELRSGVR